MKIVYSFINKPINNFTSSTRHQPNRKRQYTPHQQRTEEEYQTTQVLLTSSSVLISKLSFHSIPKYTSVRESEETVGMFLWDCSWENLLGLQIPLNLCQTFPMKHILAPIKSFSGLTEHMDTNHFVTVEKTIGK